MNPFATILEEINEEVKTNAKAQPDRNYTFFWKADEDFGELSQWYVADFVYRDITFSCMEQFMMHKKAMLFGDVETADMIISQPNVHPNVYRELGRRVANFDEWIWMNECRDIVENGNLHKFMQNPALRVKLLSTRDTILVEASPYDRMWGIGYDSSNAMANLDDWGDNLLGSCLMAVRRMIEDFMKLRPDLMTGFVNLSVDTITLCSSCFAVTRITPNNTYTHEKVDEILITLCGMCRDRNKSINPALYERGLKSVISMVQKKRDGIVSWSEVENGTANEKLIHPDLVGFISQDDCTVSRTKGFEPAEMNQEDGDVDG